MGTRFAVQVVGEPLSVAAQDELQGVIETRLEEVNAKMSTYLADSELSRFNRSKEMTPQPMSADTMLVVGQALVLSHRTDGALDVTVGPLVNAWGFGAEDRRDWPLDQQEVDALREKVGFEKLRFDGDNLTLAKAHAELEVDLSSIAKGYAVDRVAEALLFRGYGEFMVEVGGEVLAQGLNPDGEAWRIGIESPLADRGGPRVQRTVSLDGAALATSGDYRNYYERDGKRFSHAIDPRTGRPVVHQGASVSVVASTCAEADGWATALLVLGPEDGLAVAERERVAAFFLVYTEDGVREVPSSVFQKYVAE